MARNVEKYVGTTGRDKGKTFILTEMSARAGHKWAVRALFAIGQASGRAIPENIVQSGMAGLAALGLEAFMGGIDPNIAEPLLDEMLSCVRINHKPEDANMERALMIDTDIEEIQTIFSLQKEVFLLHARPFTQGGNQNTELPPSQTPEAT